MTDGDPKIFVGDPQILVGDPQIFNRDPPILIGNPHTFVEKHLHLVIWSSSYIVV